MHRACLLCECYVTCVFLSQTTTTNNTDNSRCATASRRDFAWRRSPDGQRAAPLLACLALLWRYRQAEHRIVGRRISQGKTTVFMIDNSVPKKNFIGPKNSPSASLHPISNAPARHIKRKKNFTHINEYNNVRGSTDANRGGPLPILRYSAALEYCRAGGTPNKARHPPVKISRWTSKQICPSTLRSIYSIYQF